MNKWLYIAFQVIFCLLLLVDIATNFYNYGARAVAFEVVECVKDPTGCQLDPSDVPDFDPEETLSPA